MRYHDDDLIDLARAASIPGSKSDRLAKAERLGCSARALRILQRAAVDAGTLGNSGWASGLEDYRLAAEGFVESLRSISIFDRFLQDEAMRRVPLGLRLAVISTGAQGAAVAEGAVKPASEMGLDYPEVELRKASALVALSSEVWLSGSSAAKDLIGRELRGAVAAATDAAFITGILAGGPSTASAGPTAANMRTNIGTLLTGVAPRAASKLYFIGSPAVAIKMLALSDANGPAFPGVSPTGGEIYNTPLLVTDEITSTVLALVDAAGVAGDSEIVTVDSSGQADIDLGGAAPLRTWQTNTRGIRAERYFGAEKMRDNAAAQITGL